MRIEFLVFRINGSRILFWGKDHNTVFLGFNFIPKRLGIYLQLTLGFPSATAPAEYQNTSAGGSSP